MFLNLKDIDWDMNIAPSSDIELVLMTLGQNQDTPLDRKQPLW